MGVRRWIENGDGTMETPEGLRVNRLSEVDRAQRWASRHTLAQLSAIAKDTRLPGEIGATYGVSAALIIRVQKNRP